jgi:hypothetical protein
MRQSNKPSASLCPLQPVPGNSRVNNVHMPM